MSRHLLEASQALAAYRYVLSLPASSFHDSWAISRCTWPRVLWRTFLHMVDGTTFERMCRNVYGLRTY